MTFGKPVQLSRNQPQAGIAPDAVARIFEASQDKLPTYIGATNERGDYCDLQAAVRHDAIGESDKAKVDAASARLSEQVGTRNADAYLATLKAKADVKINQANLEKK